MHNVNFGFCVSDGSGILLRACVSIDSEEEKPRKRYSVQRDPSRSRILVGEIIPRGTRPKKKSDSTTGRFFIL